MIKKGEKRARTGQYIFSDNFDNKAAVEFITRPAMVDRNEKTFGSIIQKHLKQKGTGKTVTVHLEDRNDYEKPIASLERQSNIVENILW